MIMVNQQYGYGSSRCFGSGLPVAHLTAMASAANWASLADLPQLDQLVQDEDMYGSPGSPWFNERCNFLADIVEASTDATNRCFRGRQMGSMLTSSSLLKQGIFNMDPDFQVSEVTYEFLWERDDPMPPLCGKVMFCGLKEEYPTKRPAAAWAIDEHTMVFPLRDAPHGPVRVLECYAGGHGGWSMAAQVIQDFTDAAIQVVAIENDPLAAAHFAITHDMIFTKGCHPSMSSLLNAGHSITMCIDMLDTSWYETVGSWNPEFCVISAPCQQWSGPGHQSGLNGLLGMLLPQTIAVCRKFRPRILGLEQVPAFQTHQHFPLVIQFLKASGYDIHWQQVVPSDRYGCFARPRWLCLAVLRHSHTALPDMQPWNRAPPRTPAEMGAILPWSQDVIATLIPDDQVKRIASKAKFLPQQSRADYIPDGDLVLRHRLYSGTKPMPTVMALYGSQHTLSEATLSSKGYLGFFFQPTGDCYRFLHPLEIAIGHVVCCKLTLPTDHVQAWKFEGNQISLPHALLIMVNGLNMLPNRDFQINMQEIMDFMWDTKIDRDNSKVVYHQHGITLLNAHKPPWMDHRVKHADQLLEAVHNNSIPGGQVWSPDHAFVHPNQLLQSLSHDILASICTQIPPTVEDTQIFRTMQGGCLLTGKGMYTFWVATDTILDDLHWLWTSYKPHGLQSTKDNPRMVQMDRYVPTQPLPRLSNALVVFVDASVLSVYSADPTMSLEAALNQWGLSHEVQDAFGQVDLQAYLDPVTLLFPNDVTRHTLEQPLPVFVAAAFQYMHDFHTTWKPQDLQSIIHAMGEPTPCQTLASFWSNLLTDSAKNNFGLDVRACVQDGKVEVVFTTITKTSPFPDQLLMKFLGFEAATFLLQGLQDPSGPGCELWIGNKCLWKGHVLPTTTGTQLCELLGYAFTPFLYGALPAIQIHSNLWTTEIAATMIAPSSEIVGLIHLPTPVEGGHIVDMDSPPCAGQHASMQIMVVPIHGSTIVLQVDPHTTGYALKAQLENVTQVPIANQRLSYQSKPIQDDQTLQECGVHQDSTIRVTSRLLGGGVKELNRTQVKNSLATTLLERGHDLAWVSQVADELITKAGMKDTSALAQLPGGSERTTSILRMCTDCGIDIPQIQKTKAVKHAAHTEGQRQRQKKPVPPAPDQYTIEPGYLRNADGTPAAQIDKITTQRTGVCILSVAQAEPWIRENALVSKDELAAFVIGKIEAPANLHCQDICIPCRDAADRQVIMSGSLLQLGERHVQPSQPKDKQVSLQQCQVVALTVWKQDWSPDAWSDLLKSTYTSFRRHVQAGAQHDVILSAWGRSLRHNNKPATDSTATSIQIHVTIRKTALTEVLSQSGFNFIWANPKDDQGKPDSTWKIIWIQGDIAHATAKAAQVDTCCGLVRGRASLGLRFRAADHDDAWDVIHPGLTKPADTGGALTFKLEPLPYGCDATTLAGWAQLQGWSIRPIRAVGPRGYLVSSAGDPPPGVLQFNGQPILAKPMAAKHRAPSHAIIAGPRPTRGSQIKAVNESSPDGLPDAWADYRARHPQQFPAPAAASHQAARQVDGPIEARFKQQASRLEDLETSLKEVRAQQDTMGKAIQSAEAAAERRSQETTVFVKEAITSIKAEVEKTVTRALSRQSEQLNNNLTDLKQLFLQQINKRPREEGEADMDGL